MTSSEKIPVLMTTDSSKRGVFFGYIDAADAEKDNIRAEEIQMAVYWSADVHGVLGLASMGPSKDCKISKPVKAGLIKGVTLVAECSKEAVKAWKAVPWS